MPSSQYQPRRVFISAVIKEFHDERLILASSLEEGGYQPFAFEREPGIAMHATGRERIRDSDLFIGIYGDTYSSDQRVKGTSNIDRELAFALEGHTPVLAIVVESERRDRRVQAMLDRIEGNRQAQTIRVESVRELTALIRDEIPGQIATMLESAVYDTGPASSVDDTKSTASVDNTGPLDLHESLSEASGRAIVAAGNYRHHDTSMDVVHLLAGLQESDRKGPVGVVFRGLNIDGPRLVANYEQAAGREPGSRVSPDSSSSQTLEEVIGQSPEVRRMIDRGRQFAQKIGRPSNSVLEPRHLLGGIVRDEDGRERLTAVLGERRALWIRELFSNVEAENDLTVESLRQRVDEARPPALNDSPALKDELGFEKTASILAGIAQRTTPPLVVGIYGPWGSGKSTLMELVRTNLESEPERTNVKPFYRRNPRTWFRSAPSESIEPSPAAPKPTIRTVSYNAWEYADSAKLWTGLVTDVAAELDKELGYWGRMIYLARRNSWRAWALGATVAVSAIVLVAGWLITRALGAVVPGLVGLLTSFGLAAIAQHRAVAKGVESLTAQLDSKRTGGVIHGIEQELTAAIGTRIRPRTLGDKHTEDTIRQRIKDDKLRLVVFIDELDRCPLERIVDILEAIKLFLAEGLFVVFLAVDTRVASAAIRARYKDSDPNLPGEYLEKIIQLPLSVPKPNPTSIREFIKSLGETPGIAGAASPADNSGVIQPGTTDLEDQARRSGGERVNQTGDDSGQPADTGERHSTNMEGNGTAATPGEQPAPSASRRITLDSLPDIGESEAEVDMLANLGDRFFGGNPRRIKRLLNTYRYIKYQDALRAEPRESDDHEWQLALLSWLACTMKWPKLMMEIQRAALECDEGQPGAAWQPSIVMDPELRAYRQDEWGSDSAFEDDVRRCIPFTSILVVELARTADNFLIECPRTDVRSPAAMVNASGAPG